MPVRIADFGTSSPGAEPYDAHNPCNLRSCPSECPSYERQSLKLVCSAASRCCATAGGRSCRKGSVCERRAICSGAITDWRTCAMKMICILSWRRSEIFSSARCRTRSTRCWARADTPFLAATLLSSAAVTVLLPYEISLNSGLEAHDNVACDSWELGNA